MSVPTLTWLRRWVSATLAAALPVLSAAGCASAPRFQGMSAAELHALSQAEFDRGSWDDAIEALDRLLLVFPDYPRAAEARFLLARAYEEDGQYLVAVDEYVRFLERHAGHVLAPDGALGACRAQAALAPITQRDPTHTRQAVSVCRNVARDWAAHAVAAEADSIATDMRARLAEKEYDTGQFYFRRGAYDSAILYWDMLVDEFWDTEWAPCALLGISRAYGRIGYEDDAEEYRLRLLTSYPDSGAATEAQGGRSHC